MGGDTGAAGLHRGTAFADFDGDGLVDVAVSVLGGAAKLLRNETRSSGNWLGVKLEGTASNRDGLDARIQITLPNGERQFNHATTTVGYASSSEPIIRFGLGEANAVESVEIFWSGGARQMLRNVEAGRIVKVIQQAERELER